MNTRGTKKCQTCSIYNEAGGFCSLLTSTELETLVGQSRKVKMRRGESLRNQDILVWPIIAIGAGVLSLQHLMEDGRRTIAALFMQGDIIDLRGQPNRQRGHLIALGKTEICRLSPVGFEAAIQVNSGAQKVAWNSLRSQNYRAMDHAADLAKKQALEKLASFLFECRRRQADRGADDRVHIPVRRVDLADYLGMQPETVSRCFKEMQARKIIAFQGISNLKILDIPTLRRISNGDKNTQDLRNTDQDHFKTAHGR